MFKWFDKLVCKSTSKQERFAILLKIFDEKSKKLKKRNMDEYICLTIWSTTYIWKTDEFCFHANFITETNPEL